MRKIMEILPVHPPRVPIRVFLLPWIILWTVSLAGCESATGPPGRRMNFNIQAPCPGFHPSSCEITVGETVRLDADGVFGCFFALDCTDTLRVGCEVAWESSDPAIANVSEDGLLRGISAGSSIITARGDCLGFGSRSDSIEIVVVETAPNAVPTTGSSFRP